MTMKNAPCALMMTCALVTTAGVVTRASDGWAQNAELPPIVVEGAALEIPAVTPEKIATKKAKTDGTSGASTTNDDEAPSSPGAEVETTQFNEGASDAGNPSPQIPGIAVDKLGTAVSVVTAAELERRQIRNGADALRGLPGVSVSQPGGPGSLTAVRIRGAETRHTVVLIDGVEVNSGADRAFDFANLLTEDIAQIEVLRGPQSGLYGTGALGGVINIITNSGRGPLTVVALGEAGSFNTQGGALRVSGGNDGIWGAATLQGRQTDGFNASESGGEKDGSELSNLTFSGGLRPFRNFQVDATLRRSHLDTERDNGFGDFSGAFIKPADDTSTTVTDQWLGRIEGTLQTFDGRWIHRFRFAGSETQSDDLDERDGLFSTWSEVYRYGYTSTYRIDSGDQVRHYVTGQIEEENEGFEQPPNLYGAVPRKNRERLSTAAEIRGEYFDVLNLSANVRHDNNEPQDFDDYTTWRTAGSLLLPNTPFRLHASAGTAVKYPSFVEQFGSFSSFLPNPDLTPETSFGWDAGIETKSADGRFVIDLTYFDQNLENEINFRTLPDPNDPFGALSQPYNQQGESLRRGIEVATQAIVLPGVTVGASYTYLDAVDDSGREEVRRPPHSGRVDFNMELDGGRGNLHLAAIYNGDMLDRTTSSTTFSEGRVVLDSYWLVNAAASYEISPGVQLFGRVENALNEDYQNIYGFETAGIAAYAGLKFTYVEEATRAWSEGR